MSEDTKAVAPAESMDMLRYKEELAEKMGLPSPYGMKLMKGVAEDMVASGMVPKAFAANPMAAFMASLRGREMGLGPIESVMETFWPAPGGNLGMYARKMMQLMHEGGVTSKFLKEDEEGCEILFTPPKPHEPYTARFYAVEAGKAGLDKPDSNWKKWRTDMNRARAISRGWRALQGTFGKASKFAGYSKEELEDEGILNQENSTTAPATDADQKRYDQMAGGSNSDFRANVKPVAADPEPKVVDVKPEPSEPAAAEPTPDPTPAAAPAAEETPDRLYEIHSVFSTGGGKSKPMLVPNEPKQTIPEAACLRAQALANETGLSHLVVTYWTKTGERSDYARKDPPASKSAAPDATAPTVAAPEVQAPASTPKESSPERDAMKDRIGQLAKTYMQDMPTKTAVTRFNAFFAGFLGVGVRQLPKEPSDYAQPIAELEALLSKDVNVLHAGPEQAGKQAAARVADVEHLVESNWPKPSSASPANPEREAMRVANRGLAHQIAREWQLTGPQFVQWFQSEPVALDFMSLEDSNAFMRVMLRNRSMGAVLKRMARDHNLSIGMLVSQIEERLLKCRVEEADPDELGRAIHATHSQLRQVVEKGDASQPRPAANQPGPQLVKEEPPVAAEPEASGGLFDDDFNG